MMRSDVGGQHCVVPPGELAGVNLNQRPRRLQHLRRLGAIKLGERYGTALRHRALLGHELRVVQHFCLASSYLPRRIALALGSSGPVLVVSAPFAAGSNTPQGGDRVAATGRPKWGGSIPPPMRTCNAAQGILSSSDSTGKLRAGRASALALLERLHGHRILDQPRCHPGAAPAGARARSEIERTCLLLVSGLAIHR